MSSLQNRLALGILGLFCPLFLCTTSLQAQVYKGDRDALVSFYHATNGDDWTDNSNWLSEDIGTWYGVEANGSYVLSLDLSGNNLTGQVPNTIGDIRALRRLNLADNNLSGQIPYTLGNSYYLESLDVRNNPSLSGTLTTDLINRYRFKSLSFSGTSICESDYSRFQAWIATLEIYDPSGCVVESDEHYTGTCAPPVSEETLDTNNVRAGILNDGSLFRHDGRGAYEVPIRSGSHSMFSASVWVAGVVDESIRVAAARSGDWELWSGPLDDLGHPPADCSDFDHIYSVKNSDVFDFESGADTSYSLQNWPTGLGAPTLDVNGAEIDLSHVPFEARQYRTINLDAGERPDIRGEQSVWWVMNDRGNEHLTTETLPLGIEVQGFAFAAPSGYDALNNATLFEYRIVNRNRSPIRDAYVALYLDPDLGDFDDDSWGSDTTRGMGFAYNHDNIDGGEFGYGASPPAIGVFFLDGPIADLDLVDNDGDGAIDEPGERLEVTTIADERYSCGVTCDPFLGIHYFYSMQGRWKDGKRFTFGGNGRDFSEIPTSFLYPGDPVTNEYWSHLNSDGQGTRIEPGDMNFYISSGPFSLKPGEANDFSFAVVWARGEDHLDSITELRAAADRVRLAYEIDYLSNQRGYPEIKNAANPSATASLGHNYPEPFRRSTTIPYRVSDSADVRISVFDVLGRELEILRNEHQPAGAYTAHFDAFSYPAGVYFYRIEIGHASSTRTMMLVK